MNTDRKLNSLIPEQKARKNELARALRARKKDEKKNEVLMNAYESDKDEVIENVVVENEVIEEAPQEDPEVIRKREIAEKRRASLALARSKIKPKSQITKEKDDEINKMREENERLKQSIASVEIEPRERKPKIIKKYVREVAPIKTRPKREERYIEQHQENPKQPSSINYLAEQSYAEQLQQRLRENMLNKVMYDTFM